MLSARIILKIAGAIILFIAVMRVGWTIANRYKERREKLETVILLIDRIENDIRLFNRSVEEIINDCKDTEPFNNLCFLKDLIPYEAYKCEIEKYDRFSKSDADYIVSFFSQSGRSDSEGEISLCKGYKQLLSINLEDARKKEKEKVRMIKSLSVVIAFSVTVLIM